VTVVAKEVVYNIGEVTITNTTDVYEILPGKNQLYLQYNGNVPIGSVTANLTADSSAVSFNLQVSGQSSSAGGGYFMYQVLVDDTVAVNTDITITGTISDPDASDNGGPLTSATHTFQCLGTLGTITVTRNPTGILASADLPTVVALTSTQTGAVGDQSNTMIGWTVDPRIPAELRKQLEDSFTTPDQASTDITIPAGIEAGNYQIRCTYANYDMKPNNRTGTVIISVL